MIKKVKAGDLKVEMHVIIPSSWLKHPFLKNEFDIKSRDQIHIYGRICCIADVYDALTAERSYKPKLNSFEALKIMKEEMINHFHRDIFEKFVMLFV